jgi:hypothetical protein
MVIEQVDCPADTVVTGTSGSLIIFAGETRRFIKTVLLACSRVSRITPSFVCVPDSLIPAPNSADPGDGSDSETCGPGQVLTGFTGYAGAAVDGLQAHCSSLAELASSSISTPWCEIWCSLGACASVFSVGRVRAGLTHIATRPLSSGSC